MKKMLVALIALSVLSTNAFSQTLEERVADLEMTRDLSWIKWSGSLETRYDHVERERKKDYTDLNSTTFRPQDQTKGSDSDNYYRLWANLNMHANPTDRLSFFGRLSAAKYFSVLGSNGQPSTSFADLGDGQLPNRSILFLERAFANYKITNDLVFTMGRLPTIDGPNKHIALNQQLAGNYPTLAYSAILDGFALSHSLKLDGNAAFRTKLIFTPLQTVNYMGGESLADARGNEVETSSDMFSLLMEYEKNGGSFYRKNLTIFQWVHGENTPFYVNSTSLAPAGPGPAPVATVNVNSDLNVSVDRLVLYSEFEQIFHSDFDLAAQVMYSHTRSRGDLVNCTDNAGGAVCTGGGIGSGVQGWNTGKRSDDLDGLASVVTLRYQTPFTFMNRPKVGVEWYQASKKAYVYDAANVNPINMYGTSGGDVYHLFWNQAFDGGLYMNVGYMYRQQKDMNEAFSGLVGQELKVNNIDQNIYVSLLATF